MIPKDPYMLLSYLNTQLRDYYAGLDDLCREKELDREDICRQMKAIDYEYDAARNQFI
ncbi:MAG: DUF4250 domain-containing protein [Ruminococcus sp.]|jgi:hypothetical protein